MKKVKGLPSGFSKSLEEIVKGKRNVLYEVAEYDVWFPLRLNILCHLLTDHFKFNVLAVEKLVNNQVVVVSAKLKQKSREFGNSPTA